MQLKGSFASDCAWHAKNYCKGMCTVDLNGLSHWKQITDGVTGTIQIEYDIDSTFQPHWMVPKPLPAMPVKVMRVDARTLRLHVEASFFAPWQKIFEWIGMSVQFSIDDTGIRGTYDVNGGFGIPKDAGWIRVNL